MLCLTKVITCMKRALALLAIILLSSRASVEAQSAISDLSLGGFNTEALESATLELTNNETPQPQQGQEFNQADINFNFLQQLQQQQRNLIAAAGMLETPAPMQFVRTAMNSGLRRRRQSFELVI